MDVDDKKFREYMGQNCTCFNLRRAARLVTQRYDHALRPTGLTANQVSILVAAYHEDGHGMTALAGILGMERTTVTRNVAILERLGLVDVHPGRDRRERRAVITETGKDKLREAVPYWQQAQEEVLALADQEEWCMVLTLLREVADKA